MQTLNPVDQGAILRQIGQSFGRPLQFLIIDRNKFCTREQQGLAIHCRLYYSVTFLFHSLLIAAFHAPALTASKKVLRYKFRSPILRSWGANDCQRMELHPMSDHERIIRLKTVLSRTGLSRSTMYRKIAEGTFPCQLKISIHGAGWRESAVNRWIADPVGFRNDSPAL
jgi:prophage regulatory protein